jgi:hypothetical protein
LPYSEKVLILFDLIVLITGIMMAAAFIFFLFQALEDIGKYLAAMKAMLYGTGGRFHTKR